MGSRRPQVVGASVTDNGAWPRFSSTQKTHIERARTKDTVSFARASGLPGSDSHMVSYEFQHVLARLRFCRKLLVGRWLKLTAQQLYLLPKEFQLFLKILEPGLACSGRLGLPIWRARLVCHLLLLENI